MAPPFSEPTRLRLSRFATLLATGAVGVYLLVVAGATAAIADAVTTCGTWPVCRGPVLSSPELAVAWGHRLLAAAVGVILLAAALAGRSAAADRRVGALLAAVLVLYPVQIGIGALVATSGAAGSLPEIHLTIGLAIFAALVGALAWQLEAETGTSEEDRTVENPRPAPSAVEPDPAEAESTLADVDLAQADVEPSQADAEPTQDPDETLRDDAVPSTPTGARRLVAIARAYVRLTKPRLMWLLCLVASAGMALAAAPAPTDGPALTSRIVVLTLGGGVLAIGASGTFNHVLERDVDRRMARTADRPVATHELPVANAVAFGVALAAASLALFWQVNVLAAGLGLAAIFFYSVVYTLVLKPNTVQNTVLGGFAGALPALIGWAAVTGRIGLPGLALAGIVFLWTPAHFYNLAMAYRDDYERGGFPMLPVVRGETETRKHVLWYLGATMIAAGATTAVTPLGPLYAATTAALGAVFLWAVVRLHRERTDRAAFRAFHASNAYLGALLLAVVVDALAL